MAAEPAAVAPATGLPVVAPFVSTPVSRPPTLSVAEVLALAWACGLVALVSLAGWRYGQWCRLIRQGRRLSDTRLLALLDGARQAMGVRRPVTLVALAQLSSPAVFGFRRVRLLLPETALDQLTDQDLRLLLLREMAHVRRQDTLLNVLLMAVQFVHWFNPLVWLGLHRLRADRELVCDAMVLERTRPEERSDYGGLLIKLVDDFPAAQRMIPTAVPVLSSKHELKRRLVLIRHPEGNSLAARLGAILVAGGLACVTFTGSSQQPQATPIPGPSQAQPLARLSRNSIVSERGFVLSGSDRLSTPGTFKPPVEITIVAKTDSTNLRLSYAADYVIFNWEEDQDSLRIVGGPADGRHKAGAGRIPVGTYVTIRWVVTPQHQAIYVDDQLRFEHEGDYSRLNRCISVFPELGSTVTVKSIDVRQFACSDQVNIGLAMGYAVCPNFIFCRYY
jgi:beta-lactamase regulating signal transducer with metallopeptidase domain